MSDLDRCNAALRANELYRWYNACPVELEDEANERLMDSVFVAVSTATDLLGLTASDDGVDGDIENIRTWLRAAAMPFSE